MKLGDSIVPFRLRNVDESWVDSQDWLKGARGSVVIFSCNHCPYVQAWEGRMIQLGKDYQPRGVRFVLINANDAIKYPEDSFSEMGKRANAKGFPFPYVHDEDQSVARAFGASRTPEVFLFDGGGMLQYHGRIDDQYEDPIAVRSPDLRDALEALLSGRTPDRPETPLIGCTIKWK